jgi:hypothetical protein
MDAVNPRVNCAQAVHGDTHGLCEVAVQAGVKKYERGGLLALSFQAILAA